MYNGLIKQDFSRILVVFQDEVSLWWLRVLKKGFRHCYILIPLEGNSYLEINPMSNRLFINIYNFPKGYDYVAILEGKGKRVCETDIPEIPPFSAFPIGVFTCVEFVKRVLGIQSRMVVTPYELYKKIKVVGKSS